MSTLIQWTEDTSNTVKVVLGDDGDDLPIVVKNKAEAVLVEGWLCRKVSPGCLHCYAEGRNMNPWPPGQGVGLPYATASFPKVRPLLRDDKLTAMLRWRRPRMVFPVNMSDIFLSMARCRACSYVWEDEARPLHCRRCGSGDLVEFWPSGWVQRHLDVFAEIARKGSIVQVLTKRMERAVREVNAWTAANGPLPWGVWIGFSAEDQREFDRRYETAQRLVDVTGPLWVSGEPQLGFIDYTSGLRPPLYCRAPSTTQRYLDWGVFGGESLKAKECSSCGAIDPPRRIGELHDRDGVKCGPVIDKLPRPLRIGWLRAAVEQFGDSDTPRFVKQVGGLAIEDEFPQRWARVVPWEGGHRVLLKHPKGGDGNEWPKELRVFEYPEAP